MIKLFAITLSKRRELKQGPLDLQSDALSTELSGLGRSQHQSIEIYVSKEKKSKIIKSFVIAFSQTRDLSLGPLALQPDTLPTELSGLGRILRKSMGICISTTENITPHCRHFLPLEKFPTLGNRISLGQVPSTLASIGIRNCPLEIRFPSGGNFSPRKKTPAVWEIYIP